jgi:CheY-like chemotaxis protein
MTETSSRCVLVVDDEAGMRALVDAALGGAGYQVLAAANGAEALDLLRQLRQQPEARLRAVLLDSTCPSWTAPRLRAPTSSFRHRTRPSW